MFCFMHILSHRNVFRSITLPLRKNPSFAILRPCALLGK
jgi:hypothetical protein